MTELISRLDPGRFRVHVACFDKAGAWLPRVAGRAASIVEFPIRGFARPRTLATLASFAAWCRRERLAILQTCDLYANVFGLPGALLGGVPVRIGSRRDINPDKTAGQIALQRHAYRCATLVVANAPAAARVLEQEGVPRERITVIPNGVDLARFTPRDATRPVRRLIIVANLRREKNHETLIRALARLRDRPDVHLQIVGDGPRRTELDSLVRQEGLQDRIAFLGHREDVPQLLAEADVFVLPSRSEALPNGAIEAMAAGLPVVAGAVGGLLDLVDDGRTGVLVPPEDIDRLAAVLRELVTNPARTRAMGDAARADAARRFSFDRMVASFQDAYLSQLIARGAARTTRAETAEV